MSTLRPSDLAREHGISAQAVRNYERDGFLPPARRTANGYRRYTRVHAAALRVYLALVDAYGHATGGQIMFLVHHGELDEVLLFVDRGHDRLLRDRETLDAVRGTIEHLTANPVADAAARVCTIGELAHWLRITPATLRNWETAGIVTPRRDRATGYRVYRPDDVRDAELAHLLRRGGYSLEYISTVVRRIRQAGGTEAVSATLADWQRRLTSRGVAMLAAAARLHAYLALGDDTSRVTSPATGGDS